MSLFVSPLRCPMKTSHSHSLTSNPMYNLHKGVMAHVLLLSPSLSIRLSGFAASVCAAEFPRLCHPSFFHSSLSLSVLPVTCLVTSLFFSPLLLINPCIHVVRALALAVQCLSFPDILVRSFYHRTCVFLE